jgi:MHS family proline/betaine transporter-like MFS transporter
VLAPIAGMISDRVGRTTHMLVMGVLLVGSIFPAFLLFTDKPTPGNILLGVLWLGGLKALYFGPLAALMSELFPPATRATGLGLSYNIGVTVFGGMGPAIMTWLGGFPLLGDLAPGYYLTVIGILSLTALVTIRRTAAL